MMNLKRLFRKRFYKAFCALGITAVLSLAITARVFAYYDCCDCFAYYVVWHDDEEDVTYSETVVQREKGGFERGVIEPGERLMVFSSENQESKSYSGSFTIGGRTAMIRGGALLNGIEGLAKLTDVDVYPGGEGKICLINGSFVYDNAGDEAGIISSFENLDFFDIYTFEKRAYFETSGRLSPAGDEYINFYNVYEVSVINDGHGDAYSEEVFGREGLEAALHAEPDAGYEFKEWQVVSGNALIADKNAKDTVLCFRKEDVGIKAVFEKQNYKVTVLTDGRGSAGSDVTDACIDTDIALRAEPYYGYKFKEWQVISGDGVIENDILKMPPSDVTVRAVFETDPDAPPQELYTVTFDPNGGDTEKISVTADEDGMLSMLPTPVFEGAVFKGWWTLPEGGVQIGEDTVFGSDMTVYAHWEKTPEADPLPEDPSPAKEPLSEDTGRYKLLDLEGKKVNGVEPQIRLFLPQNTVSYNGREHVAAGSALSKEMEDKIIADLSIGVEGVPSSVKAQYIYGKSKPARYYYGIMLVPDKSSTGYNKTDVKKQRQFDREIKKINRILKKKKNLVFYSVKPLKLEDFAYDPSKSTDEARVFTRAGGSGDLLALKKKAAGKKYNVLEAVISGYRFEIPSKEYEKIFSSGTWKIKGRGPALAGETR